MNNKTLMNYKAKNIQKNKNDTKQETQLVDDGVHPSWAMSPGPPQRLGHFVDIAWKVSTSLIYVL